MLRKCYLCVIKSFITKNLVDDLGNRQNKMKRAVLSFVVVATIATSTVFQFGCSKKSEIGDTVYVYQFGYNVPVSIVPKEKLPEFLRDRIDNLWESYVEKPLAGTSVQIFRGKWNKRTVYYSYHSLSSCMFCDVWYSDGTILDWSNGNNFEDFYSKNRSWVLIYQIVGGVVTH